MALIALSTGLTEALIGIAEISSQGVWPAVVGFLILALVGVVGGAIVGLVIMLGSALSYWLIIGFLQGVLRETIRDQDRLSPNQGIWRSGINGLILGTMCGLIAATLGGATTWVSGVLTSVSITCLQEDPVGRSYQQLLQLLQKMWNDPPQAGWADACFGALWIGLSVGLLVALLYGALAFLRHAVVRFQLWRAGLLPGRLRRFLDDAVACSILRLCGPAGYEFAHRFLQDSFAGLQNASWPDITAQPEPVGVGSSVSPPAQLVGSHASAAEQIRPFPAQASLPCGHPFRERASFCNICGVPVAGVPPRSPGELPPLACSS